MKKSVILIGIFLSACSNLNFDNISYDRFISISERAAKMEASCTNVEQTRSDAVVLLDNVNHMDNYAKHRPVSPEVALSVNSLQSLVQEFNDKYLNSAFPSKVYCEQKLKNISIMANSISETIGKLN